jgi:hypothetical protein
MVGIGLVSLLLATLEYRRDIAILVAQFLRFDDHRYRDRLRH